MHIGCVGYINNDRKYWLIIQMYLLPRHWRFTLLTFSLLSLTIQLSVLLSHYLSFCSTFPPSHCFAILFCTLSPISSHCSLLLALSCLVFHLSFSPSPLYLSPLPAAPHSFIYLSLSVVSSLAYLSLSPFPFIPFPSLSLSST